jgi:hypothetical protein
LTATLVPSLHALPSAVTDIQDTLSRLSDQQQHSSH